MSSHASPAVSITILGTLRLLRIPRSNTNQCMHAILRMLLFRSHADPFISFTMNDIELSIFAEGDFVDRVFGPILQETPDLVEASDELWVALQVETHGDNDYENSGNRVRELAQPLAAEGISILYVSTYISDFILLKEHRLEQVIRILQRQSGFTFQSSAELDNLSDASSISSEEKVRAWTSNNSHHDLTESSPATSIAARSRAGSLYLHDASLVDGSSRQPSPAASQSGRVSRQPSLSRSTNLLASLTLTSPKPFNDTLPNVDTVPTEADDEQEPELDNVPRSFEDPLNTKAPTSALSHLDLGPKLCVLPDELVCVGLNPEYESSWREKLVQAFFYSDDVLPPTVIEEEESNFMGNYSPSVDGSEIANSTDYLGRNSSVHPSSSQRRKPRTFADSKREETSIERSPSTSDADHPTPFVSFTATLEGCSLTGDIRLLRRLFPHDEGNMVFTAGEGGLDSTWIGEAGDLGESDGRGRRRRREEGEEEHRMDDSRRLLKCLQLNLASFGLDKHGIVNALTDILTTNGINLLYNSTFATANILVSKQDLSDARRILLGKI